MTRSAPSIGHRRVSFLSREGLARSALFGLTSIRRDALFNPRRPRLSAPRAVPETAQALRGSRPNGENVLRCRSGKPSRTGRAPRRRSRGWLERRWRGLRRVLHVLNRPVRAARGKGGIAVRTYRGYGSRSEVFMIGRVLRQPGGPASGNEFADLGHLLLQRGVRGKSRRPAAHSCSRPTASRWRATPPTTA